MIRRFAPWRWGLAIIGVSLLLRIYKLTDASIWSDEGFSLEMITYPVDTIWWLSGQDVHPPLYYLVLKGWVELMGSHALVWVRGLSVIFGTLNVALGMWLMLLISTRRAAAIAGLLLALLPMAVRYSQDVRMYSMLGTFLLGATIALVYWVMHPSSKRYLVVYVLLMVASFYTHYFSFFAACSHWLYLCLIRLPRLGGHRHIEWSGWWLANVSVAVLFVPWLPSMFRQLARFDLNWVLPLSINSVPSAIWRFLTANDGSTHNVFIFWLLPLVYGGIAISVLLQQDVKYRFNVLIVICGFLTIIATAVASLITPVFVDRYLFFSVLMLPLILALALEKIRRVVWVAGMVFLVMVIEAYGLKAIYSQQHTMNNPYRIANNQLARLMAYFDAASIDGDVLVVSDAYIFYAAEYYGAKGRKVVIYTPPTSSGASGRPNGFGFNSPMLRYPDDTYLDHLDVLESDTHRVWVLQFNESLRNISLNVPDSWRLIQHELGGDNVLSLYVMCSLQATDFYEACDRD